MKQKSKYEFGAALAGAAAGGVPGLLERAYGAVEALEHGALAAKGGVVDAGHAEAGLHVEQARSELNRRVRHGRCKPGKGAANAGNGRAGNGQAGKGNGGGKHR